VSGRQSRSREHPSDGACAHRSTDTICPYWQPLSIQTDGAQRSSRQGSGRLSIGHTETGSLVHAHQAIGVTAAKPADVEFEVLMTHGIPATRRTDPNGARSRPGPLRRDCRPRGPGQLRHRLPSRRPLRLSVGMSGGVGRESFRNPVALGLRVRPRLSPWPPICRVRRRVPGIPARRHRRPVHPHPLRRRRTVRPRPHRRDDAGLRGHEFRRPGHRPHRGNGHATPSTHTRPGRPPCYLKRPRRSESGRVVIAWKAGTRHSWRCRRASPSHSCRCRRPTPCGRIPGMRQRRR
jgi:hypothetical protein